MKFISTVTLRRRNLLKKLILATPLPEVPFACWMLLVLALSSVQAAPSLAQEFRIGQPASDVVAILTSRYGALDTTHSVKTMHINDGSTLYNFGPYSFYRLMGRAGLVIDSGRVSGFSWAMGANSEALPTSEFRRIHDEIGSTYGPPASKSTIEPQRVVRGWRTDTDHAILTFDHGHLQFALLKNEVLHAPSEEAPAKLK